MNACLSFLVGEPASRLGAGCAHRAEWRKQAGMDEERRDLKAL